MRTRFDPLLGLAVALPVLAVTSLALHDPVRPAQAERPPFEVTLDRATVVCPSAIGRQRGVVVLTPRTDREVRPARAAGPFVDIVEGAGAPGLLAGRFARPTAAADCGPPVPEQWYTGLGAAARHHSVLELVNPDPGPAVADVVVHGRSGVVDAPFLRGVAVPGQGSIRFDLAEVLPRRDELALQVTASRGRVFSSVVDRIESLGRGPDLADWLPAQQEAASEHLVLGLPAGSGSRTLVIANPGEDETRASVRLVSEESTFAPTGLDGPVRIPPGGVVRVNLGDLLSGPAAAGVLGVLVEAADEVTVGLRSLVGGDLSHALAGSPEVEGTTALLPPGAKRLVLAGATSPGVVRVSSWTAAGDRLPEVRIEVGPDRGATTALAPRAAVVRLSPERTAVHAVVLVRASGTATVRLRREVTAGLVPAVRPGLG